MSSYRELFQKVLICSQLWTDQYGGSCLRKMITTSLLNVEVTNSDSETYGTYIAITSTTCFQRLGCVLTTRETNAHVAKKD